MTRPQGAKQGMKMADKIREDFKWVFRRGYRVWLLDQYQAAAWDDGWKRAALDAFDRGEADLADFRPEQNPYRSE